VVEGIEEIVGEVCERLAELGRKGLDFDGGVLKHPVFAVS